MPEAMGCNIGNHLFHIFPDLADIINHRRQQTVEPIDDAITSTLNSDRNGVYGPARGLSLYINITRCITGQPVS